MAGMWGEGAGSPGAWGRHRLVPEAAPGSVHKGGWALVPKESKGFKEGPYRAVLPTASGPSELVIPFCPDQPGVTPSSITLKAVLTWGM